MLPAFRQRFGPAESLRIFRAPGRVNLIGEHTDYNLGLVLPMALDLATYVATAPASGGKLHIASEHRNEVREWDLSQLAHAQPAADWTDYPIGVACELLRSGIPLEPARLFIRSTVPEGAGLSSSAALEVAVALALLRGRPFHPLALAQLCQRAEAGFAGMPCGLMDQFVSVFGCARAAIELDCRSLLHQVISLPQGIAFAAINTMVKHALASSAYKQRVEECREALEFVRQTLPEASSLRDLTPAQLLCLPLPEPLARRVRHVVTENARVVDFAAACRHGDVARMGQLLFESHRSLQADYEVSCPELDFVVETARRLPGVYGARMTGGGFGGCAVVLMHAEDADRICGQIREAYRHAYGIEPQIYPCIASAGAGEINNLETIPARP